MAFLPNLKSRFVRFGRWLIRFGGWLKRGEIGFAAVLVVLAALIWPVHVICNEQSFRIAGGILQLVGVLFALRGLFAVREFFENPPLSDLCREWVKDFPRWKVHHVLHANGIESQASVGKARMHVWHPIKPDDPLEERVNAVVINIEQLRDDFRSHLKGYDEDASAIQQQIKEISQSTEQSENSIRSDLKEVHTADAVESVVGLVWVMVGIVITTFAPELPGLIDWGIH